MIRRTGLLLAIFALSACRVEESTRPNFLDVQGPSLGISDGSVPGGNDEFFFYPPLAANPSGNPNFDAGAFNPFLQPYATICELALNGPLGPRCVADVTPVALRTALKLTGETYSETWKTSDSPGLNSQKFYRIEVFAVPVPNRMAAEVDANFIETYRYGFRDIDPDNGPSVGACGMEAFCKVQNGSNIAIKVRIERFASCPETRECVSRFVPEDQATNLKQPSGNQITIPGQSANFFLNFDVCTTEEEAAIDAALDLPTFGPCFKTETPFTGTLNTPALISICQLINFIPEEYSHTQKHQITLHHFHTPDGTLPITNVEALPEGNNCTTTTASVGSGRLRLLARAIGDGLASLLNPQPLHATTVAIDVGGGGFVRGFGSLFKLALPAKFDYLNPSDALRSASNGSTVILQAKVTDLVGNPVPGARVRWSVQSSPGGGASLSAPATLTNSLGVAEVSLTVPKRAGTTIVHAAGNGIADSRGAGCTVGADVNASCNGPRTSEQQFGPFDPFIPLNLAVDGTLGTEAVQIAAGTRLVFQVMVGGK